MCDICNDDNRVHRILDSSSCIFSSSYKHYFLAISPVGSAAAVFNKTTGMSWDYSAAIFGESKSIYLNFSLVGLVGWSRCGKALYFSE